MTCLCPLFSGAKCGRTFTNCGGADGHKDALAAFSAHKRTAHPHAAAGVNVAFN